jgi:four helix bundle protein
MALRFHEGCLSAPAPSYLRDQLNRASSSIALNLAEGSGRPSKKEQARFYSIALGSLRESQAILDMMKPMPTDLKMASNNLGGSIFNLIRSAETSEERKWQPKPKTVLRTENRN